MNKFTTGRLLEPKTKSFNDKVYAESLVFKPFSFNPFNAWIGINGKRGQWGYTSSATKLVFENWALGEPNNPPNNGAHICVHFWKMEGKVGGKWADYPCDAKKFFICEFV
jgi:hypothetical protein